LFLFIFNKPTQTVPRKKMSMHPLVLPSEMVSDICVIPVSIPLCVVDRTYEINTALEIVRHACNVHHRSDFSMFVEPMEDSTLTGALLVIEIFSGHTYVWKTTFTVGVDVCANRIVCEGEEHLHFLRAAKEKLLETVSMIEQWATAHVAQKQ
jgi:hypothetical protein